MNNTNNGENGSTENREDKWEVRYKDIFGLDRIKIAEAIQKRGDTQTALRFAGCRKSYHVFQCGKCSSIEIAGSKCENRLCPECGEKKLNRLIAKNADFLQRLPTNPRGQKRATLLTLTLKNIPDSEYCREDYDRLTKYFNEFIRHPRIKGRIRGGLYAIETKRPLEGYVYHKRGGSSVRIGDGREWNLHIHALVDMDFMPWQVARGVWKGITDGSFDIDLRAVKASIPAMKECFKYAVKAPNLGDADSYAKFLEVTKGKRLYNTFGSFRTNFNLGKTKSKECLRCKAVMRYCFDIGPHEALRYRQYLEGGPPVDAFGYTNDVGMPESVNRLLSAGPFFKPILKKNRIGVDA